MTKIKDIYKVLENYKKIVQLTNGQHDEDLDKFMELLKAYRTDDFEKFEQRLQGNQLKKKKASLKDEALKLGDLYFKKTHATVSEEEKIVLAEYLEKSDNQVLKHILEVPLGQAYEVILALAAKDLTANQLYFLGMALLNIKLKGSSKAIQKKNLLDMLWSTVENQQMHKIYNGECDSF